MNDDLVYRCIVFTSYINQLLPSSAQAFSPSWAELNLSPPTHPTWESLQGSLQDIAYNNNNNN